jgi:FkbM family methyltransferase
MHLLEDYLRLFFGKQVIKGGQGAGIKLAQRRADAKFALGTYEPAVQEVISSSVGLGQVFYDIGANIGFFSLIAARRVGRDGRVYAFEPVPRNARSILLSARLNRFDTIEVFPDAVGGASGRANLLLARHIGGAVLASVAAPPDISGSIEVNLVTIDHAIQRYNLRPPHLIKIDVEGAELDVLDGMKHTLLTHRPKLICEVDDASSFGADTKARAVSDFLVSAGYEVSSIPPSYGDIEWSVLHLAARPLCRS